MDGILTPDLGLFFWTLIIVLAVVALLSKYAWKPILKALKEREESISQALESADKAKKEMEQLQAANEKLLAEARMERDQILKEARQAKDNMISEAREKAQEEAAKVMNDARENIQKEKTAAIGELRNTVVTLSLELAERVLSKKFEDTAEQEKLAKSYLEDFKLN